MQRLELDNFLEDQIEGYLFADLMTIKENVPTDKHPGNAAYLMTGAICAGMEFLGTLLAGVRIEEACACGQCKRRESPNNPIDYYCKNYLSQIDIRYKKFGPILTQLIRNGLAHSFATKGKVGITRIDDGRHLHLVKMSSEEFIIINPDRLFEDFKKSYEKYFLPDIRDEGGDKRDAALKNYQWLKKKYEKDINDSAQSVKRLETWPVVDGDVEYRDGMVEIVEANGDIAVVS